MSSIDTTQLALPLIDRKEMKFIGQLAEPEPLVFIPGTGIPGDLVLDRGICWIDHFEPGVPETARTAVMRVLDAKSITEEPAGFPIRMVYADGWEDEEYECAVSDMAVTLRAGGVEGLRRALYAFADAIKSSEGATLVKQQKHVRHWLKHRISRCFFGPTGRAPFFIDELLDEVDYYPEAYLDKLASEDINGLWITFNFRNLKSSVFPQHGQQMEQRLKKLRQVVDKLARYGIKLFLYCSEPKGFGEGEFRIPAEHAAGHPELLGPEAFGGHFFCLESPAAKEFLRESVRRIFSAVPGLGGLICILFGEDNGACTTLQMLERLKPYACYCCAVPAEVRYREMAGIMTSAMHAVAPEAEFIGWFYTPGIRDGDVLSGRLASVAAQWPRDSVMMLNFESGGIHRQLGLDRPVFDYSLAYVGPSGTFRNMAETVTRKAAKLQVGCSHEDASVPFLPVPGNLHAKYSALHELGVEVVMQCWYFGNYPGLMNRAAGMLSREPFPPDEVAFLSALAEPDWGIHAPTAVQAWRHFAAGYRCFPANLAFSWYGPLHSSIVWPLHLFPVDTPLAPSWILKQFPEVSGDRIGECLIYQHTLTEAIALTGEMEKEWHRGFALLEKLRPVYERSPARMSDIDLAEAILLQIRSANHVLRFYHLREDMLYNRRNHLHEMRQIVTSERTHTLRMKVLCGRDSRLGYHSEAENYLFHADKLEVRAAMLEHLLQEDFPRFSVSADLFGSYTGSCPEGFLVYSDEWQRVPGTSLRWRCVQQEEHLRWEFENYLGHRIAADLEPCRLWPSARVEIDPDGSVHFCEIIFRVPQWHWQVKEGRLAITLPWNLFDGYRHSGFPARVGVLCNGKYWNGSPPWPHRLLHEDYNPTAMAWLLPKHHANNHNETPS